MGASPTDRCISASPQTDPRISPASSNHTIWHSRVTTSDVDIISIYLLIMHAMRRKQGALVPLEAAILVAAASLQKSDVRQFHGYQIARHLADVADRQLLTAYGTLYRALGRLEKMGLLRSHWEDPQIAAVENRPGRRLYTLTGDGIAAAQASRRTAPSPARAARRRRRVAPA